MCVYVYIYVTIKTKLMLIYSIHGYYTYQRSGIGQRVEPSREPVKLWVSLGFGDTATVPGSMFNWGFDAIGAIYCIFFCKFASPMYNRSSLAKYHCPKKTYATIAWNTHN